MKTIFDLLSKGYDIKIRDMNSLGMGYNVEIYKRILGTSGFNLCVPTKDGKSIYYGHILNFKGNSLIGTLDDALNYIMNRPNKIKRRKVNKCQQK
jgi:hypothetical protein